MFDAAVAGGEYTGSLRTAVVRFKFHKDPAVLDLLKEALLVAARRDAVRAVARHGGVLVPVPMHPLKRWLRGWDPVAGIAEAFLPAAPQAGLEALRIQRLLRKSRWSRSQVGLPRSKRTKNPRGTFQLRRRVTVPRGVVLLDDVLTTGSTASECARVLKRGGVREVVVLAAARSRPGS